MTARSYVCADRRPGYCVSPRRDRAYGCRHENASRDARRRLSRSDCVFRLAISRDFCDAKNTTTRNFETKKRVIDHDGASSYCVSSCATWNASASFSPCEAHRHPGNTPRRPLPSSRDFHYLPHPPEPPPNRPSLTGASSSPPPSAALSCVGERRTWDPRGAGESSDSIHCYCHRRLLQHYCEAWKKFARPIGYATPSPPRRPSPLPRLQQQQQHLQQRRWWRRTCSPSLAPPSLWMPKRSPHHVWIDLPARTPCRGGRPRSWRRGWPWRRQRQQQRHQRKKRRRRLRCPRTSNWYPDPQPPLHLCP
mmetsp:Transcript_13898/g.29782  ORF Transcript_13898/g.29782 Transcript_13898/m.29782 type:complete len:307 (+) Transcript_13898:943-1863(+)